MDVEEDAVEEVEEVDVEDIAEEAMCTTRCTR